MISRITFDPKEALASAAGCCMNAFCLAQGLPAATGAALGAVAEGTVKGFSLEKRDSPILDTLRKTVSESIICVLKETGLDYLGRDFEALLLEQVFSPQAVSDYLTGDNPIAMLEENIRTAAEASESYEGDTLPVSDLAEKLIESVYTAIQNQPELTGLATFYTVQEIRAAQNQQQKQASDFERLILSMRPVSEFHSPNPLHYLNPDLGFQGRRDEFRWLDQFRDAPQKVLYAFVQGSGGVGKSRLLYEYVTRRQNEEAWYLRFLTNHAIETLPKLSSWECSRDVFLVVDYAGRYASLIGKWILSLSESNGPARKIRVVLIERQMEQESDQEIEPDGPRLRVGHSEFWIDQFYGNTSQRRILAEAEYGRLAVLQLDKLELFGLMDDYAVKVAKKAALPEEVKEQIFRDVLTKLNIDPSRQTPLFVLLATDAFLNEGSARNWNIQLLTKSYVDRMLEHWAEMLCGRDRILYDSLLRVSAFATATGGIDLNGIIPSVIERDVERVLTASGSREMLKSASGLQDDIILPLRPDYIGEFIFLQYLNELFPEKKRRGFLTALYVKPTEFTSFFVKCIQDFASSDMFRPLFEGMVEALRPADLTCENSIAYGTIVMHLSAYCDHERVEKCVSILEQLFYDPIIKSSGYFKHAALLYLSALERMTYINGYDVIPKTELSRIIEVRKDAAPHTLETMLGVCRLFDDQSGELFLPYASALANVSFYGTYSEAEAYAEKLCTLYMKYNGIKPQISVCYAVALNNIIFKLSETANPSLAKLAENTLEKLAKLYKKHVLNAAGFEDTAVLIVNAVSDPELRKSADKDIRQLYGMLKERQVGVAAEYAKALNNIVSFYVPISRKKAFKHFEALEKLYRRHQKDEVGVAVEYAKSMVALIRICSEAEADRLLHTLCDLRNQYATNRPVSDLLTIRYVKTLFNRLAVAVQNEESGQQIDWAFDEMVRACQQLGTDREAQKYFIYALYHRFIIQFKCGQVADCSQILETLKNLAGAGDTEVSSAARQCLGMLCGGP